MRLLHELWRRGGAKADGEVHGYVWRGNVKAQKWWGRRGLSTVWVSREADGWGDGKGVTRRAYKAENENEYGYMRGEWVDVCGKEDPALDEEGKRIRRICKMYDTIEAMKEDKAVYRAL
jgi:hypothetical protein